MQDQHSTANQRPASDLGVLAVQAHDALVEQQAQSRARMAQPQSPPRLRAIFAATLVLAVCALAWDVTRRAPAPTPAQLDAGRLAMLSLIASSLADHLRAHGGYPEQLQEALPLRQDGSVQYRRFSNGYELALRSADGKLIVVRHD